MTKEELWRKIATLCDKYNAMSEASQEPRVVYELHPHNCRCATCWYEYGGKDREATTSAADLDMRDRFGHHGFQIGDEVEWSPDLQVTWRHGVIREIDLPNSRITVQEGGTVYAIAYRDVRRPSAAISGGGKDDCGDQTHIVGEDINGHDVPCFIYKNPADGLVYKLPRK